MKNQIEIRLRSLRALRLPEQNIENYENNANGTRPKCRLLIELQVSFRGYFGDAVNQAAKFACGLRCCDHADAER